MRREQELASAPEHCRAVRCSDWKDNACRLGADVNECKQICKECPFWDDDARRCGLGYGDAPPRCEDADREADRRKHNGMDSG